MPSGSASGAEWLGAAVDPSTPKFHALALQVRAMGLLDRRPGYYWVKIVLTILAFFAGWALFVYVGDSWTALAVAPLLGIMFTQLGFIGHDAGHNQVFRTRQRNRMLGLTVGDALIGLSFGWWVPKHNAHHAHPNEMGRDPDIGEGSAVSSSDAPGEDRSFLTSWLARWQAPLFFPLMVLRSTGMHVLGIQRLARRRDRAAAAEICLLLLHTALYLTVVLWVLSPVKAVAFIVVQQAVFSVYLGISFAPNHKGMPIIESGTASGFARRQVVTARNITGGRFTTFMLGGLNYQIEHHLFPSMPRPNLRRVQGLVRDFCIGAELGYSEESFYKSFRQIVQHLSDVGAATSFRPQPPENDFQAGGEALVTVVIPGVYAVGGQGGEATGGQGPEERV
jgi:fatty acid desaturase